MPNMPITNYLSTTACTWNSFVVFNSSIFNVIKHIDNNVNDFKFNLKRINITDDNYFTNYKEAN